MLYKDGDVITVPRYDAPDLWDSKSRRQKCLNRGENPDQLVRVRMTGPTDGVIIERLSVQSADAA